MIVKDTEKTNDKSVDDTTKNYYMMSYTLYEDGIPRWVRAPFRSQEDVMRTIQKLKTLDSRYSYENLEILNEETLDESVYVKTGSGEFVQVPLRMFLFDWVYQMNADQMRKSPDRLDVPKQDHC